MEKFGLQEDGSYTTPYAITFIHNGDFLANTLAAVFKRSQSVICAKTPQKVSSVIEFLTPMVVILCEIQDTDEDFLSRGFTRVIRGNTETPSGLWEFLQHLPRTGAVEYVLDQVMAAKIPGYSPSYEDTTEQKGRDFLAGVTNSEDRLKKNMSDEEFIGAVANSVSFLTIVDDLVSAGKSRREVLEKIARNRIERAVDIGDKDMVSTKFVVGGDCTDIILKTVGVSNVVVWSYGGFVGGEHRWIIIKNGEILNLDTAAAREFLPMLS